KSGQRSSSSMGRAMAAFAVSYNQGKPGTPNLGPQPGPDRPCFLCDSTAHLMRGCPEYPAYQEQRNQYKQKQANQYRAGRTYDQNRPRTYDPNHSRGGRSQSRDRDRFVRFYDAYRRARTPSSDRGPPKPSTGAQTEN